MPNVVIDHALDRDFTEVRESPVAGKGLFAKNSIHRGARIIEYKGKRRSRVELMLEATTEASRYLFHLDDGMLIDGYYDGNDARFINHSCDPNCEAHTFGDKVFIYAMRDIPAGEELFFDYKLQPAYSGLNVDEHEYKCNCGSRNCRGTLLANSIS